MHTKHPMVVLYQALSASARQVADYDTHSSENVKTVGEIVELSEQYEKAVKQETSLSAEELVVATVGKVR